MLIFSKARSHLPGGFAPIPTMLFSSRLLVLLAASATALNLGAPVLRSTRPTLRRVRTGRFAQAPRYLTLAPAREPPPLACGSHWQ